MTTLLFVDHAPAIGGAERSLLLLMQHLDSHRWHPRLACVPGQLAQEAQSAGLPTSVIALPRLRRSIRSPWDWLRGARTLARSAREVEAVALVANTVRSAFYTALAARLARRPFVWYMRDFWLSEAAPSWTLPDRLGKLFLASTAVLVIANSHAVATALPVSRNVRVVHNGIDVQQFSPGHSATSFRRQIGIPSDVPLVGMIGRLRPWKGQKRFIQMAEHVARENEVAHFTIVGGAPLSDDHDYPERLRRLVREKGLAERVHFTGHLSDVRPALANLDLFVHPGDPEPFGLVNVEAMAMGVPVVAFSHGALPEIVVDGKTGLLVSPVDVAALATAVLGLLGDDAQRRQLGVDARAHAENCFSIERTAAGVSAALEEIF